MNYLGHLDSLERRQLADELNASDRALDRDGGPALGAYLAALERGGSPGLGGVPVKVLAGVQKDAVVGGLEGWMRQVGLDGPAALPPPNLAADIDELVPVPPRRLRRLVTVMMDHRFKTQPQRLSREDDAFDLSVEGLPLRVLISHAPSGGRSVHQLDCNVRLGATGAFAGYERLWRLPSRWDYLTVANAERSVEHLGVLISTLAGLTS